MQIFWSNREILVKTSESLWFSGGIENKPYHFLKQRKVALKKSGPSTFCYIGNGDENIKRVVQIVFLKFDINCILVDT